MKAPTYTVNVEGKTRTTKSMNLPKTTTPMSIEEMYNDTMEAGNFTENFDVEDFLGEDIENITVSFRNRKEKLRIPWNIF